MKHKPECLERTAKEKQELDSWLALYPNHCTSCGGAGAWSSPGSFWEPPDGGPCGCVEDGKCPRCGKETLMENHFENEIPCPNCGWNWGKNKDDIIPSQQEWPCECEQEEIDKAEKEYWDSLKNEPTLCPHGKTYDCYDCNVLADFAYDAARERRHMGFGFRGRF